MKTAQKIRFAIPLIALLILFVSMSSALAGASEVWVNGVKLDAGGFYLANGSTTATTTKPSGLGYAYFDVAASTLTLDAAVLTSLYTAPGGENALVYADGELTVILKGDSSLIYHGASINDIRGIWSTSTLTLTGTGTADIDIENNDLSRGYAAGIVSGYDLNVLGGDYDIHLLATDNATGISAVHNTVISGGQISIHTTGRDGAGINSGGNIDISGGWIDTTGTHANVSMGMYGDEIFLRGGEGLFRAGGAFISSGLMFSNSTLHVSGGDFVFSGGSCALNYAGTAPPAYDLSGVDTFVSEDAAGLGRWLWKSKADGELASSGSPSPFLYVQFSERRSQSAASLSAPQTGDGRAPWLWAGIALVALLAAAGIPAAAMRRKTR